MNKLLSLLLIFCFLIGNIQGQTRVPCCEAPNIPNGCGEAGTSIANACVICNLAGVYIGNNSGYGATGNFSCGIPHNSAYVSAIIDVNGVITATLLTQTQTCNTGESLQLILFDQVGNEIDCFSVGRAPNATVSASGLTPGELVTFQIDGFNGDVCDFVLIIAGSEISLLPNVPNTIRIDRDTLLCPGDSVCFEISPVATAIEYDWIIPDNLRLIEGGGPNDLFACCIAESEGGSTVQVVPINLCFRGVPGVLPIVVRPGALVYLPPIEWCGSEFPFDTVFCDSTYTFSNFGEYRIDCETTSECDSVIILNLVPAFSLPQFQDSTICLNSMPFQLPVLPDFTGTWSGDGVLPDGTFDPRVAGVGTHQITGDFTQQSCTSTTSFSLEVVFPPRVEAFIDAPIWDLGTGDIFINVIQGQAPFQYKWSNRSTEQHQMNLLPGEYCLTVTDQNNCQLEDCYQINSGFSIAPIHIVCSGESVDLAVTPSSGATFDWSPAFRLSCTDCANPKANPNRSIEYTVTATLPDGSSESQNVIVIVLPNAVCNGLSQDGELDFAKIIDEFNIQKAEEKNLIEIEKEAIQFFTKKEIKIAPNPTDGIVNIFTPEKIESVEVFDLSGKQVMSAFEKEIDLSSLAKGGYFFKIKVENEVIVKRVVLF